MRVDYAPAAQRDLAEIVEYIARDDHTAAYAWLARLLDRANLAAVTPRAGRIVPEWNDADVREVFLRTYRIVYRIESKRILVLRVFEGHRRLSPRKRY